MQEPCNKVATVTLAWASPAMPGLAFWHVCSDHADELQSDWDARGYAARRMNAPSHKEACTIIVTRKES